MIWVIKRVREALPEMIELNHIGYHIGYLFKVKMRGTSFLSVFQGLKVFGSNHVTSIREHERSCSLFRGPSAGTTPENNGFPRHYKKV